LGAKALLEAGQFSTDLDGYTILARSLDSASGVLKGVTIYDNTNGRRSSLVSADSGTIEFSADYSKFIIFLKQGEIHQIIPNRLEDFRKIEFNQYQIVIPASGFAFVRSNENMISRGDREMKIADMERIVQESTKNSDSAKSRVEKRLSKHYKFLAGIEPNPVNITRDTNKALTWSYGLHEVEKRINYIKANIVSDSGEVG